MKWYRLIRYRWDIGQNLAIPSRASNVYYILGKSIYMEFWIGTQSGYNLMEYDHIHYKSSHLFLQLFTSDLQYKYQIVFFF